MKGLYQGFLGRVHSGLDIARTERSTKVYMATIYGKDCGLEVTSEKMVSDWNALMTIVLGDGRSRIWEERAVGGHDVKNSKDGK